MYLSLAAVDHVFDGSLFSDDILLVFLAVEFFNVFSGVFFCWRGRVVTFNPSSGFTVLCTIANQIGFTSIILCQQTDFCSCFTMRAGLSVFLQHDCGGSLCLAWPRIVQATRSDLPQRILVCLVFECFVDFRLKGTYQTYVEAFHWSIHDPSFIYIV